MKILLFRVHKGDPLSAIIQWITRGVYTHAAFLLPGNRNEIIESYWPHVRRRVLRNDELAGIDVFELPPIHFDNLTALHNYCVRSIKHHEPYSIAGLFAFLPLVRLVAHPLLLVFRPLRRWVTPRDTSSHAPVFCSQFVLDACRRAAHLPLLLAPSDQVDPWHLAWSPLLTPAKKLEPIPDTGKRKPERKAS